MTGVLTLCLLTKADARALCAMVASLVRDGLVVVRRIAAGVSGIVKPRRARR